MIIDTDVAIHLRDGTPWIVDRIARLHAAPFLSVVSQVELEGGVYADIRFCAKRRKALDAMLQNLRLLVFDRDAVACYREIVATLGYSRRKVADRMIAATALAK